MSGHSGHGTGRGHDSEADSHANVDGAADVRVRPAHRRWRMRCVPNGARGALPASRGHGIARAVTQPAWHRAYAGR